MVTKRTLFMDTPSAKRTKTNSNLTKDVAKLTRAVNANKPELLQATYTVLSSSTAFDDSLAIINPTAVQGDEIKLHKVVVRSQTANWDSGTFLFGRLLSPKQGYVMGPYNDIAGGSRGMYDPNATQYRNWSTTYFNTSRQFTPTAEGAILHMEKTFSIPMTCGTVSDADPTVTHNQIFLDNGGLAESAQHTYFVTIYYTDN